MLSTWTKNGAAMRARNNNGKWTWFSSAFLLAVVVVLPTMTLSQQPPNPLLQVERFGKPNPHILSKYNIGQNLSTFRTDLCHLSHQVERGELALEKALEGVVIHTIVMEGEFVNFKHEKTTESFVLDPHFPGLVPLLLDDICKRAGCKWRDTYATVSYHGMAEEDKSFTDLLVWATDVYDLAAEWWMRTNDRLRRGTTVAEPWYDATIIMVARKQEQLGVSSNDATADLWGWLAPFDEKVWIMIVVTLVATTLLHYVLEMFDPAQDPDSCFTVLWRYATAFARVNVLTPKTPPARVLSFSITFWALLVIAAYTANLTSFLVIRHRFGSYIKTLEQAVSEQKVMCVWNGTGTDFSVKKSFPGYSRSGLLKRMNQREVYEALQNGECEIAITEVASWEVFQNDATLNGQCNLEVIGVPFQHVPASFGVKADAGTLCTALLRNAFDLHLHDMQVDGTIDELWRRHKRFVATVNCNHDAASDDDCNPATGDDRKRQRRNLQRGGGGGGRDGPIFSPARSTSSRTLASKSVGVSDDPNEEGDGSLSLANMGGVFLMHAVVSGAALLLAIVLSWTRAGGNQRQSVREALSSASIDQLTALYNDNDPISSLARAPFQVAEDQLSSFIRESVRGLVREQLVALHQEALARHQEEIRQEEIAALGNPINAPPEVDVEVEAGDPPVEPLADEPGEADVVINDHDHANEGNA